TRPVVVAVSQATRAFGSSRRIASRIASEVWWHILSGRPSVTHSEVNRYCDASTMLVMGSSGRTFRPRVSPDRTPTRLATDGPSDGPRNRRGPGGTGRRGSAGRVPRPVRRARPGAALSRRQLARSAAPRGAGAAPPGGGGRVGRRADPGLGALAGRGPGGR